MNPFVIECECEVCGGPGACRPRDAAAMFYGGLRHSNPAVCAMYLEERKRKLEAKEKELEHKETVEEEITGVPSKETT